MQVQIDNKYRFIIPEKIREELKIKPGQKVGFEVKNEKIFLILL